MNELPPEVIARDWMDRAAKLRSRLSPEDALKGAKAYLMLREAKLKVVEPGTIMTMPGYLRDQVHPYLKVVRALTPNNRLDLLRQYLAAKKELKAAEERAKDSRPGYGSKLPPLQAGPEKRGYALKVDWKRIGSD